MSGIPDAVDAPTPVGRTPLADDARQASMAETRQASIAQAAAGEARRFTIANPGSGEIRRSSAAAQAVAADRRSTIAHFSTSNLRRSSLAPVADTNGNVNTSVEDSADAEPEVDVAAVFRHKYALPLAAVDDAADSAVCTAAANECRALGAYYDQMARHLSFFETARALRDGARKCERDRIAGLCPDDYDGDDSPNSADDTAPDQFQAQAVPHAISVLSTKPNGRMTNNQPQAARDWQRARHARQARHLRDLADLRELRELQELRDLQTLREKRERELRERERKLAAQRAEREERAARRREREAERDREVERQRAARVWEREREQSPEGGAGAGQRRQGDGEEGGLSKSRGRMEGATIGRRVSERVKVKKEERS